MEANTGVIMNSLSLETVHYITKYGSAFLFLVFCCYEYIVFRAKKILKKGSLAETIKRFDKKYRKTNFLIFLPSMILWVDLYIVNLPFNEEDVAYGMLKAFFFTSVLLVSRILSSSYYLYKCLQLFDIEVKTIQSKEDSE